MRPTSTAAAMVLVGLASGSAAEAADHDDFRPTFEVTPFVGYRISGSIDIEDDAGNEDSAEIGDGTSFGVDLGLYRDSRSFYEFFYSRKEGDLDTAGAPNVDVTTEYYQIGGTLLFDEEAYFVPYLSLTVGAARLAPDGPYDSETRFAASLGGGMRFPVSDNVTIGLGLRGYLTFLNSESSIFCVGSGDLNCLIKTSGSTYFEGEATLGVSVIF